MRIAQSNNDDGDDNVGAEKKNVDDDYSDSDSGNEDEDANEVNEVKMKITKEVDFNRRMSNTRKKRCEYALASWLVVRIQPHILI